jgi:peptidoglycan/LPS O-acetylase OafA/YrhL
VTEQRLQVLDAFRGIAAIGVVIYHTTLRYPGFMLGLPPSAAPLFPGFREGEAGVVPVLWFFLLSGFVITWTVDRCRTPMDFVVSRVSRIYPAYWASIALTVAAVALVPLPGVAHTPMQVLANLTMLQSLALIPDVAGVYWSLAVEILFYLYALALFAAGLWRFAHLVAFAWACLGLAIALLEYAGLPTSWRVNQLLLLHFVPFLMGGMALYRLWRRQHRAWSAATIAVCAVAIALSQGPVSAALCYAGMAVIAAAAEGRLRWLATPPLLWLGSISYSLYLVHEYPSYMVIRALDHAGVPHMAAIAAAILASLILASAVSYGVERPAMRALRRAWRPPQPGAVHKN